MNKICGIQLGAVGRNGLTQGFQTAHQVLFPISCGVCALNHTQRKLGRLNKRSLVACLIRCTSRLNPPLEKVDYRRAYRPVYWWIAFFALPLLPLVLDEFDSAVRAGGLARSLRSTDQLSGEQLFILCLGGVILVLYFGCKFLREFFDSKLSGLQDARDRALAPIDRQVKLVTDQIETTHAREKPHCKLARVNSREQQRRQHHSCGMLRSNNGARGRRQRVAAGVRLFKFCSLRMAATSGHPDLHSSYGAAAMPDRCATPRPATCR